MQTKSIRLDTAPGIHAALSVLATFRLPFQKALALSKLCGHFGELQQVYLQQLNALAVEHGTKFLPNGSFPMPEDATLRDHLIAALNSLTAEDVEVEFESIEISAADIGEQRIGAADILALDGIIAFS